MMGLFIKKRRVSINELPIGAGAFSLVLFLICFTQIYSSPLRIAGNDSEKHISRPSERLALGMLIPPVRDQGAVVRGSSVNKKIALLFTGDEFGEGGIFISRVLQKQGIQGSFFLTGNFYRNKEFRPTIRKLRDNGNYLGSHSDKHLLYCDWKKRDSLLVTKEEFTSDVLSSYRAMRRCRIRKTQARYFLPPFEWYNSSIAEWTSEMGLQLINFTPGTKSNADYTYPEMGAGYVDSETIYRSILNYEKKSAHGLNGFMLLVHIGTDPRRKDKFYFYLPKLIRELKARGYEFSKVDDMLR